jgi:hypothetical protein
MEDFQPSTFNLKGEEQKLSISKNDNKNLQPPSFLNKQKTCKQPFNFTFKLEKQIFKKNYVAHRQKTKKYTKCLEKKTLSFLVHIGFLDNKHRYTRVVDAKRDIY